MAKRLWIACALFFLCAGAASAQDAKTVLQAAQKAMGDVTSIQYSGTGHINSFGQAWTPECRVAFHQSHELYQDDRLHFQVGERRLDPLGAESDGQGRRAPIRRRREAGSLCERSYAWDMPGSNPVPNLGAATEWGLQIWLTPQGFVKAAIENNATAKKGTTGTLVTFTAGKYKVRGTIDAQNMVVRTETWVNDPDVGDKDIETTFSGYKDFGGMKFPAMIVQKQEGFPTLVLNVSSAKANPGLSVSVPDSVKNATPARSR